MDNIDLFDRYINNQLTGNELTEFKSRLKSDKEFSNDFKVYSMSVVGIIREAEQDNKDFQVAMQNISDNDLLKIIGKNKDKEKDEEERKTDNFKNKAENFRKWLVWQSIGVAALIGIVVIYVVIVHNEANNMQMNAIAMNQESMNKVDDAIFAFSEYSHMTSRSGDDVEISEISDDQLKAIVPVLEQKYGEQKDDTDIAESGTVLVMAYVKLHEREKARVVLNELINRFQNNEEFKGDLNNWKTILKLLN